MAQLYCGCEQPGLGHSCSIFFGHDGVHSWSVSADRQRMVPAARDAEWEEEARQYRAQLDECTAAAAQKTVTLDAELRAARAQIAALTPQVVWPRGGAQAWDGVNGAGPFVLISVEELVVEAEIETINGRRVTRVPVRHGWLVGTKKGYAILPEARLVSVRPNIPPPLAWLIGWVFMVMVIFGSFLLLGVLPIVLSSGRRHDVEATR